MAGVYQQRLRSSESAWFGDQGFFLMVTDCNAWLDPSDYATEVGEFIARARGMRPFPGLAVTDLPGGLEVTTACSRLCATFLAGLRSSRRWGCAAGEAGGGVGEGGDSAQR